MFKLEAIKTRLRAQHRRDGYTIVAIDEGAQWLLDIRALVAEVERLQKAEAYLIAWICDLRNDDLLSCGHPISAIIRNVCKEGEFISSYCGVCNDEAEARWED